MRRSTFEFDPFVELYLPPRPSSFSFLFLFSSLFFSFSSFCIWFPVRNRSSGEEYSEEDSEEIVQRGDQDIRRRGIHELA